MNATASPKYVFSGHDSFQCRQLWLKKGFDFVSNGGSFNDPSAVVVLGVGKNMVAAIRYWLKAFNIIGGDERPTEFGQLLLNDNGWDPYLEDDASLWLLHYQLIKSNIASIYHIIFTEFRRERIEFSKESFVTYMKRKADIEQIQYFNPNTVADDFDVFRKMYLSGNESSSVIEDSFSGLLCDLNLLRSYKRIDDEIDESKESLKKTRIEYITIEDNERTSLPDEIFLYTILCNKEYGNSISLQSLEQSHNGPGAIFALSRPDILDRIYAITKEKSYHATFSDDAGIKELQFKRKPNPITILNDYYNEG